MPALNTPKTKRKTTSQRVVKRRDISSRLGHMTIRQAERFLGDDGAVKLRQGGRSKIDPSQDIKIFGDTLSCKVPEIGRAHV